MKTNTKHWASITAGILSLAGYASASLGSEKYTYDVSGNLIKKSIDGKVTEFTFDKSNRLLDKQIPGKATEVQSCSAAEHSVLQEAAYAKNTRTMIYGYGNRVLNLPNGSGNIEFYYNAEGQMVGEKATEALSTYIWDGNVLAADGVQIYTNEAHTSGGVPILNGEETIVVSDSIGNTLAMGTKNFNSTAYGEGLEGGRLTGKPFNKELGSFVFNHRLYSPKLSRWTSADPSGFPDGENNFSYVNCDPISNIDPTGLAIRNNPGKLYNKTKDCNNTAGATITFEADGFLATKATMFNGSIITSEEDVINNDRKKILDDLDANDSNFSVSYSSFTGKSLQLPVSGASTMEIYGAYPRHVYDAQKFVSIDSGTPKTGCSANHSVIAASTAIGAGASLTVFSEL